MTTVIQLKTPSQEKQEECPFCGTKTPLHERVWVPYPWPFNKAARKQIDCPLKKDEK